MIHILILCHSRVAAIDAVNHPDIPYGQPNLTDLTLITKEHTYHFVYKSEMLLKKEAHDWALQYGFDFRKWTGDELTHFIKTAISRCRLRG